MSSTAKLETTDLSSFKVVSIPCLSDNFAYLMREEGSGQVALIDAPEAAPIEAALDSLGWTLTHILITHHHDDHVGAVEALRKRGGAVRVVGSSEDAGRLPPLDEAVTPGATWSFGGHDVRIIATPGHTVGHIVYHLPEPGILFSGDTLFAMGCGRLFEGTALQMWTALSALSALPDETQVFFGHEYTAANARFALSVDPQNGELSARARQVEELLGEGGRTTPTTIGLEKRTNPFLRAPQLADSVGLPGADGATAFAEIRRRKDAA